MSLDWTIMQQHERNKEYIEASLEARSTNQDVFSSHPIFSVSHLANENINLIVAGYPSLAHLTHFPEHSHDSLTHRIRQSCQRCFATCMKAQLSMLLLRE